MTEDSRQLNSALKQIAGSEQAIAAKEAGTMRLTDRLFGALAGILGIAALIVTVTQQAIVEHAGSAVLVISSAIGAADRLALAVFQRGSRHWGRCWSRSAR